MEYEHPPSTIRIFANIPANIFSGQSKDSYIAIAFPCIQATKEQRLINFKSTSPFVSTLHRQYESKDKLFRSQLSSLGSLLPIIQVHLLMCTTFSSSASKYEFLDLVFQLMERLAAIAHLSHPLRFV